MDSITKNVNSLIESWCRTCNEKTSLSFLHSLEERTENSTCLADMLLEIAKINIKIEGESSLPKHICGNCMYKLKNAYYFVVQAQHVNKQFLVGASIIVANQCIKQVDCLQETPIDVEKKDLMVEAGGYDAFIGIDNTEFDTRKAVERHSDTFINVDYLENLIDDEAVIKQEIMSYDAKADTMCNIVDPITVGETFCKLDGNNEESYNSIGSQNSNSSNTPITCNRPLRKSRRHAKEVSASETNDDDELFKPEKEKYSDSSEKPLPIIRKIRKRRSTAKNNTTSNEARFPCKICGETFAWKKSVLRHERSHSAQPEHACDFCERKFFRKDNLNEHLKTHLKSNQMRKLRHLEWNFASRLYSDKPFQLMQCKLCDTKFSNTRALRQHLNIHASPETLQHLSLDSEIAKEFFGQTQNLYEVKSIICKDILQQQFTKYFLVVNEFGYEMSLSDSDMDITENEKTSKYKCELCQEIFFRKHLVFAHIKEKHACDQLPYRCKVCKVKFVSEAMYQMHAKTQCRCKEKRYKCVKCPGKFMWLENLKEHKCSNRKGEDLACNSCDETFSKLSDLTSHMAKHEAENSAYDCTFCDQQFSNIEELHHHNNQEHTRPGRQIRCCLCEKYFMRLSQLREHLQQHADGTTGVKIAESHFFKVFYPQGCAGRESEVASVIAADLVAKNWTRYYITLDESYNELDLYDTDTDNEGPHSREQQPVAAYECNLCQQSFSRRKHILSHQISDHSNVILPFSCTECCKRFVSESLLQHHLNRDCLNVNKKFQCEDCGSRFVWEENLKIHLQARHSSTKQQMNLQIAQNLQCDLCFKMFIWPRDLSRHKRDMHKRDDEKYECPYCDRKFNRKDNMNAHLKVHGIQAAASAVNTKLIKVKGIDENLCKPNGTKIACCMICQYKHSKISELQMHLCTHQFYVTFTHLQQTIEEISCLLYPEEPPMNEQTLITRVMADIAMQRYERFYSITNQVGYELSLTSSDTEAEDNITVNDGFANYLDVSTSKNYCCDLCGASFKRKYKVFEHQMLKHEWNEAQQVCDKCNARFVSETALQQHYKDQCKNIQKHFLCRKCPRRFMWRNNLKAHLRTLHDILEDSQIEAQIGSTLNLIPEKKYLCELCGFASAKPSNLVIHLRRHTGEKPYKCDFCDKAFPNSSDLQCHRRSHTGEKPHICMVCNKAFPRAYKLRVHMRLHSGEHPHVCSYCNKNFTLYKNLVAHERKHTGVCAFKCDICGLGFSQGIQLRKHRKTSGHLEEVEPKRNT